MLLPSILGDISGLAMSSTCNKTPFNISLPSSGWVISRPRKKTETFTLCPLSINRRMLRTLWIRSWVSVRALNLTSLMDTEVCFFPTAPP